MDVPNWNWKFLEKVKEEIENVELTMYSDMGSCNVICRVYTLLSSQDVKNIGWELKSKYNERCFPFVKRFPFTLWGLCFNHLISIVSVIVLCYVVVRLSSMLFVFYQSVSDRWLKWLHMWLFCRKSAWFKKLSRVAILPGKTNIFEIPGTFFCTWNIMPWKHGLQEITQLLLDVSQI